MRRDFPVLGISFLKQFGHLRALTYTSPAGLRVSECLSSGSASLGQHVIFLNNTKLKPLFILAINNRSKAFVQPISVGNRSSED